MFPNRIFFQKITCPYIRKNTECNTIFCPFNHLYQTLKEQNYDTKKRKYSYTPNISNILPQENYVNVIKNTDYQCNDSTSIYDANKLKKNVIFKDNKLQNYSETNDNDIGPKFIHTLVHIPHKTQQEFLRIYSKTNQGNFLARNISLEKELEILNSTYQNKSIYINSCKNYIISLKNKDILHENTTNTKNAENAVDTIFSNYKYIEISLLELENYILSDIQLQTAGYILDIPIPEIQTSDVYFHCDRCNIPFIVKKIQHYTKCRYHWGKLIKTSNEQTKIYSCCHESNTDSIGCITSLHHVFKITSPSKLAAEIKFVASQAPMQSSFLDAAVLDCEMIYTTGGMELARITIYDICENLLIDKLIKPKNKIIDFNTRWSGIKSLDNAELSLSDLHNILFTDLKLCSSTILIGHGLENDLIAIRLVHKRIIDTALLFQDEKGLQRKHSLKYLAKKYLKREIQTNITGGHDSKEDAKATLDLVRYKIYHDNLKKIHKLH
ncbi:unnamed protein product [Pneumocystis jirovecii]|uniref:Exonuclease domain-containing protein n=1 Tax=Pneumocystis jirovecii TaxID=42068 RepID=L0PFA7_PNEJI|nr:unnamed protein product [Pneumocystis jirovecii]